MVVSRVALETAPARQVLRQAGVTKTDADRRISRDALKIQMLTRFPRPGRCCPGAPTGLELSPDAFAFSPRPAGGVNVPPGMAGGHGGHGSAGEQLGLGYENGNRRPCAFPLPRQIPAVSGWPK